ncbi:uncharacterized protein BCR38DRAFT_347813 [Pseudomassariella vexata]|uniref:X-Pro dipeptidyl-peptidase n=1 Tax=Pseudomassariella vexata TaxID=1141098 RepID=A0A1Y2DSY8_9PEZI|nr:uncharacterized protein BCR38DRAFT_347813 [Pseudomassariella vexata]ORY61775.1 hypothetical protein BCR38DRAFT_347813 [Pseudomassariella vexata]
MGVDEEGWVVIPSPNRRPSCPTKLATGAYARSPAPSIEPIQDRIVRVVADLKELKAYYKLETSVARFERLYCFYGSELDALREQPFDGYTQEEKVDYLLLQNYLARALRTLGLDRERDEAFADITNPFALTIMEWAEARMRTEKLDAREVAASFHELVGKISSVRDAVLDRDPNKYSREAGYRAANSVVQLRHHLAEMVDFYKGYDPQFDWWVSEPYGRLDAALMELSAFLREELVGIQPGDKEAIVGQPIGREGLLTELKAEFIPYTPEELIKIAEKEYKWCESEMIKASKDLGYGDKWRDALEHVKNLIEPPGGQPVFIKSLIDEGTDYVKKHDLVSVPKVAEEAIRMTMIEPARQKVSPFFLGGNRMQVSYPTSEMSHADKLMSMRGNNRHFSKATAFHEMIPGHHLQLFVAKRIRPYRRLFNTPFFVEGWALYWELLFWDRGDYFTLPEDRIGSMFWRMHRCARIVFSLNFHLGKMKPQECINLLVDWVGHERSAAEGEVRRSLNGDYSPLYQAGYLLGALQLWELRKEVVGSGKLSEKTFHDRVLRANFMPIAMLRALIMGKELDREFESEWRFYGDI